MFGKKAARIIELENEVAGLKEGLERMTAERNDFHDKYETGLTLVTGASKLIDQMTQFLGSQKPAKKTAKKAKGKK